MSSSAVGKDESAPGGCLHTPMCLMWLALVVCLLAGATTAQESPNVPLQATIVVFSTNTGEDRVTFAFNRAVPEKEAVERFHRLMKFGGWQGKLLRVRTESPRTEAGNTLPPLTDVIGRAQQVIDRNSGGLPVEPFLRAFSDLDYFEIYFFVQGDMPFQGLREWSTPDLQIRLIQTPGVYRYQVRILRHAPDVDLRVPFLQPVQQTTAEPERKESASGWRIAGWALISVALGTLAYLIMRWAMRHSSVPASVKRHESTREG